MTRAKVIRQMRVKDIHKTWNDRGGKLESNTFGCVVMFPRNGYRASIVAGERPSEGKANVCRWHTRRTRRAARVVHGDFRYCQCLERFRGIFVVVLRRRDSSALTWSRPHVGKKIASCSALVTQEHLGYPPRRNRNNTRCVGHHLDCDFR